MRRNFLQRLLTCLLLLTGISAATAQTTTLISYTNQWSYLVTNALPPGGWTNVNYPAAAGWPVSRAPFAQDTAEAMPGGTPPVQTTLAMDYNGNYVTSYYFRTTFNLPSSPTNLIFTANALIDDGAVFYVNGRRVQNVRMTAGTVSHNSFATGDGGGDVSARGPDTFVIPSTNFIQGANTIAVSVHQVNGTSSDIVFGMELETQVIQPPVIVTHPQSQTIQVGRRATFEVDATGTGLSYRWFANGVLISTTTNFYITPIATLGMDGTVYHVIVSNVLGAVQSNPAVLRVIPDTFGPIATVAFMTRSNWIDLRFDETLAQGPVTNANSITNFSVMVLGTGERIPVTNVTLGFGLRTNVTLRLPTVLDHPTNYVVCAYNMEDQNGFVSPSTCVPLSFTNSAVLVQFNEIWRYNDNQFLDNSAPTNASATIDWKHVNYPDDPLRNFMWLEGPAPLRDDIQFSGLMCTDNQSGSALGRTAITSYMRKRFVVTTNYPAGAVLVIRRQFDDGGVVYLNGREIHRVNVPPGTPSYGTYAISSVDGSCTTVLEANGATNLIRGQNILAVELHQFNEITGAQHDTFFDMELSVSWPVGPIIPDLRISLTNAPAPSVRLNWSTNAAGWQLQSAPDVTGPWTPVATTSTNYQSTISQSGPRRFYRMANPPQ